VPGEHDNLDDVPLKSYLEPTQEHQGHGWYSFDQKGVHFIGLNKCDGPQGRRMACSPSSWLGLADDVKGLSASSRIVVFRSHPFVDNIQGWGWAPKIRSKRYRCLSVWFGDGAQRSYSSV